MRVIINNDCREEGSGCMYIITCTGRHGERMTARGGKSDLVIQISTVKGRGLVACIL